MFEQLISLLTLSTITLASFGLGRPVLRGLGFKFEDSLAAAVWSIATGLILAGISLTAMGLVGLLHVPTIGVLTLAAGFWGVGELVNSYMNRRTRIEPLAASQPTAPRFLYWPITILAAAACAGSLIGALAPPTAGDAMCYHLALPKTFLAQGGFCFLPYHDRSTFPLLAEIWFLWAMAIDSPTAAALVHWGLGVLFALAAALLARPIVGRDWAWIAACLVILTPGVNNQMAAPLNDVAHAAMTTLALAAWWKGAVEDEGRRWFLLSGLAAGAAASTKYIAALFALAMAATVAWEIFRAAVAQKHPQQNKLAQRLHHDPAHRRNLLIGATIVAAVAAAVASPWYLRAAWHRGNPVYPFLAEMQHDPGAGAGLKTLPASKSPLGRTPWGLAAAPWQLTMHPEKFGGRGHQLGALWLAALPGLFFARRLRGLGLLLSLAAVYSLAWFLLRQNERFLFPILPLLAVGVAWVWMECRRMSRLPRAIVIASQAAILLASATAACTRHADCMAAAVGLESRDDFLARREPLHGIVQFANDTFQPGDRILSQDYDEFYFHAPVVWESIYRRVTRYQQQTTPPREFGRSLRRQGFTHLLLAENISPRGIQYDPTLSRLADADPSLNCLISTTFRDTDGGRRLYRLVELPRCKTK